ncbi:hypothetical protein DFQ26_007357 [Actinomortierella ambigua]|nr:hypothetical protein DFQ26_007357 [Actinomortierella ambigua]
MRQNFLGVVVGTAMQKTVKVRVMTQKVHPIVRKTYNSYKNYLAHDEASKAKLGDIVRIEACRPVSARKHFTVAEIVNEAKVYEHPSTTKKASA